jgi:tRNA A37 threonylcarbamoyladenosine modification protein TsaB
VFDARRGELYCGLFRMGDDGGPVVLLDGAARTPAELQRALDSADLRVSVDFAREICFFGDGIDVCGSLIDALGAPVAGRGAGPIVRIAPLESRFQNAASAARLARYMLQSAARAPFARAAAPYTELFPVYMRKPEAERKLADALRQRKASDEPLTGK